MSASDASQNKLGFFVRLFGKFKKGPAIYVSPITGLATPSVPGAAQNKKLGFFARLFGKRKKDQAIYVSPITCLATPPPAPTQQAHETVTYVSPIQTLLASPPTQTAQSPSPTGTMTYYPPSLTSLSPSTDSPHFPIPVTPASYTSREISDSSSSGGSSVDTPASHYDHISDSKRAFRQNSYIAQTYQSNFDPMAAANMTAAAVAPVGAAYYLTVPQPENAIWAQMQPSDSYTRTIRNNSIDISGDNVVNIGGNSWTAGQRM